MNLSSRMHEIARKTLAGGTMLLRYGLPLLETERSSRKIAGYRTLPKLVAALRVHDIAIERESRVANEGKAA